MTNGSRTKGRSKGQNRTRASGSRNRRRNRGPALHRLQKVVKLGLDAFSDFHLPLPTAVGAYHTITTKTSFSTTDYMVIVGSTMNSTGKWRQTCAMGYPLSTTALNALSGINYYSSTVPFDGLTDIQCVPAASSCRVTCNTSLLNASGICYIGRLKTAFPSPDALDTRTAANLASACVSYAPVRTITNAELVAKPKQINSIPHDMSELHNFAPFHTETPGSAGYDHLQNGFTGYSPIVIINPTGANLQLTVATEWRVRVDPFSPFHSTGKVHPPTSNAVWHAITNAAHAAGDGVEDVGIAGLGAAALEYASGGAVSAGVATVAEGAAAATGFGGILAGLESIGSLAPLLLL